MKVRVLTQQEAHSSQPDRHAIACGAEVELPQEWATELLKSGQAEPIGRKPSARAETR